MNKKVELLAPAGDMEKLKWAILYGADAIYLGGVNYSLRANAKNFTLDEIKDAVIYAHGLNKKIYVTVNIAFHDEDTINLEEYLVELNNINVDAVIFSDPLVLDIINNRKLNLEAHLSTQESVLNKDAALYFKNKGVSRIVLARECSREDIIDIINSVDIDIETFIHGAMCTNISGRCVLSNYFTNRDANRGGCCQVCRFNFNLYDKNKVQLTNKTDFSIAPKDLSLVDYLKEMIDIGISSFKLEGRMRSIYYVATIVLTYRRLIDMYLSNNYDPKLVSDSKKILYRCANRDVAPQFYNNKPGVEEQYYIGRKEESNQDFLAVVMDYDKSIGRITVEQRNFFKVGDRITIFGPNHEDYTYNIEYLLDENDCEIDAARHPQEVVKINCNYNVSKNDLIRIDFLSDK